MSRLSVPNLESDTSAIRPDLCPDQEVDRQRARKPSRPLPPMAPLRSRRCSPRIAVLAAGTLTKSDQEIIKLVISGTPVVTTASPRTIISPGSPV